MSWPQRKHHQSAGCWRAINSTAGNARYISMIFSSKEVNQTCQPVSISSIFSLLKSFKLRLSSEFLRTTFFIIFLGCDESWSDSMSILKMTPKVIPLPVGLAQPWMSSAAPRRGVRHECWGGPRGRLFDFSHWAWMDFTKMAMDMFKKASNNSEVQDLVRVRWFHLNPGCLLIEDIFRRVKESRILNQQQFCSPELWKPFPTTPSSQEASDLRRLIMVSCFHGHHRPNQNLRLWDSQIPCIFWGNICFRPPYLHVLLDHIARCCPAQPCAALGWNGEVLYGDSLRALSHFKANAKQIHFSVH